ncbi:MAG TPA: hypothetical protein PKE64_07250 [Anaerolineae bacterium]|nr:hypothetical protein [Anaerolineae bacterium]HMR63794.1 hypothetical protein [Anaerolineae bacterium]
MSKRMRHLIENQAKVTVAQHTVDRNMDNVIFTALAGVLAGVFYFFGYYFWDTLGRVLTAY